MLNICPTCASTNTVRILSTEPGLNERVSREMVCDACSSQWFERNETPRQPQMPAEITAEAISSHGSRPMRRRFSTKPLVIKAPPPPAKSRQAAAAAAFCLSIFLALGISVARRDALVRHLPQTASLFRVIGLPVNLRGLAFRDVKTRLIEDNGQQVLAVEGIIASVTRTTRPVPPLRVSLRGDDGREIYTWTAQPTQPQLAPGGTLLFRTRLASPPANAHVALVNFTNADGAILR